LGRRSGEGRARSSGSAGGKLVGDGVELLAGNDVGVEEELELLRNSISSVLECFGIHISTVLIARSDLLVMAALKLSDILTAI
jgi:hypothetical protein